MSEVTGSIPVGDLVLSLSHVRVMLIIALFTFLDKIGTAVNFNHIQTTNGHGTGRDGTGLVLSGKLLMVKRDFLIDPCDVKLQR